ncbi:MAG TPA: PHB depolymerase family esterase [Bryobacteraceae bacterium]|nr:PHB depolymerase family esterase [Bryobacteraceae bacterium]
MAVLRRSFLLSSALAFAAPPGCNASSGAQRGRLTVRRVKPSEAIEPGLHSLGLAPERDGLLYVPPSYSPRERMPLIVFLHGAGGTAQRAIHPMQPLADKYGFLVLAPDSRGRTWDAILGTLGPDVAFLDLALEWAFRRCNVNYSRVAVSGFSDGASYALTLGVVNGTLFSHAIAFSPCFLNSPDRSGLPAIFISHGTRDEVLPIKVCSRRIVPQLRDAGYSVNYVEFDGPHKAPSDIRERAVKWFMD